MADRNGTDRPVYVPGDRVERTDSLSSVVLVLRYVGTQIVVFSMEGDGPYEYSMDRPHFDRWYRKVKP